MPEKEFLEGIRRCQERAEAAHSRAEPDVCVMNAHLVVEYGAKVLSIRQGRTPKYESLKQILNDLLSSGVLSSEGFVEMDWLRQLRNQV